MMLFRFSAAAALSMLLSVPTAAQPAAQTILVWSYGFSPQPLHLAAGRPVTLTFVNRSGSSHDFTASAFFASSRITAGAAPDGEIELRPRETKSITLIPRAGVYSAHCSHFFHKQLGMSDQIVVD
ncbi:MAG: cupredoxin domain-containing protein [Sphingomonas sp.]